jgi:acyl-CoA thioester hydrolase
VTNSGFVAPVHVRWSDIDMYQHINHATMVTILEEARIPFLREPFGADITTIGLLIADVKLGYEVRSVGAAPDSKPSVIAETQLAAVHIEEQRLQRLSPAQRDYLQHWTR